jgi:Na+-driven multidrug efflux pump
MMLSNLMLNALATSFTGPSVTFFAQAAGTKNYRLLGLYYRRQILLSTLFFIPFAIMTIFSDKIALAIG